LTVAGGGANSARGSDGERRRPSHEFISSVRSVVQTRNPEHKHHLERFK